MDDCTYSPPLLHPRRETLEFLRAYARKNIATDTPDSPEDEIYCLCMLTPSPKPC